ncbi:histidine biosynthesis bifunctional protein hisIE [Hibiscus syriacus]|uniref:Glycosyltransferase n=1 Tax=Hibiscus syriacus TaxID=106335 RepID=A0A6A3C5S2_HIBSY|nr:histidine biosynthesis bifunctional protein hisIE [Hibiscus syriacus]
MHKLLDHLVIVALDQNAYNRCRIVHKHCYVLVTMGVDFHQEAYFRTPQYLKMMWTRIDFLRTVLQLGYSFVFTDADIMWFRDPFPRFFSDADFQIECDKFLGGSDDMKNRPNGGFNYVKSNNRTIAFYKLWCSSREIYPKYHDQDVLNKIKLDPLIRKMWIEDTILGYGLLRRSLPTEQSLECGVYNACKLLYRLECREMKHLLNELMGREMELCFQCKQGQITIPTGDEASKDTIVDFKSF